MASRPVLHVTAQQQKQIDAQQRQIDFLARLAGVELQMNDLRFTADANNPADPIPDPPSQGPAESTDQARTPGAYDDPRVPGMTPGSTSGVPAASSTTPMQPGAALPTSPYGQLVDVTAPISGTEGTTGNVEFGDQAGRDGVTRIETDVRALGIGEEGDQMNPTTAFPWTISPDNGNGVAPADGEMSQGSSARAMASLRLAKARIQAGMVTAGADEFALAARIENDAKMTPALIDHELGVLARMASQTAGGRRPDLVPRVAAAAQRPVVPSLAESPRMPVLGSQAGGGDEVEMSDFLLS